MRFSTYFFCMMLTPLVFGELIIKAGITDFRPFYSVDSKNKLEGSLYGLMTKTMEKAGLQYTMIGYPAKRLYTQLADGRTHTFFGLKGSPIYEGKVLYSKQPLTEIRLRIYGLTGTEMPKNIKGLIEEKVMAMVVIEKVF